MAPEEKKPVSKAQQKAVTKYMKENYDSMTIRVPKGQRAKYREHAQAMGESLNAFAQRAMDEATERDTQEILETGDQ